MFNNRFINVVYVRGIPKVFNQNGEEIRDVIDLNLKGGPNVINTIQMETPCNVYSTVEEMMDHIKKKPAT